MIPPPVIGLGRDNLRINIRVPKSIKGIEELESKMLEATMDIAIEAKDLWETLAGQNLRKTRYRYIHSLEVETDYKGMSYVRLKPDDKLSIMLEKGVRPYDLKPGLLAPGTRSLHMSKDGVPFRNIYLDPDHRKGPNEWVVVSGNTPEQDWWHPGFEGLHLRSEVYKAIKNDIAPKHVKKIIDELNAKAK